MKVKEKNILPPRPVHPRSVIHHGLFGKTFVKQHMIIDEKWSPNSLEQQFGRMAALLERNDRFSRLEKEAKLEHMGKTYQDLQKECRDGRTKVNILRTGNQQDIRNILIKNRQLQRLFQGMPIHQIEDKMDQNTFALRKERDRLQSHLLELKSILNDKYLEKADLENRISYENEFKLEEETMQEQLQKKIEVSKVRLQAVKTINVSYKKIAEILAKDAIFYEPILRSLDADVQDQENFIKHILYLGSPALVRFRKLKEQYESLNAKSRESALLRLREISKIGKRPSKLPPAPHEEKKEIAYKVRSYVRETKSMLELKAQFAKVQDVLKNIQVATLSSNVKEIFPRFKFLHDVNVDLGAQIGVQWLVSEVLEQKMNLSSVLHGVLVNDLAEDEIKRLEHIKSLKEAIIEEDKWEENTLVFNKNLSKFFVLMRFSLWNLYEIMKHVGPKVFPQIEKYPVDYLHLPLLKYENYPMMAIPPTGFEPNASNILKQVKSKLRTLTSLYDWSLTEKFVNQMRDLYGEEIRSLAWDLEYEIMEESEEDWDKARISKKILDRNQIKLASARLVAERKKEF